MAFTNPPLIELVADNLVRLSFNGEDPFGLAAGASGTIGLFEKTVAADVTLPEAFKPRRYGNALQDNVSLQASIQATVEPTGTANPLPGYSVAKSGTSPADFEITITNNGDPGAEDPDIEFEIYIRFH